MMTFEEALGPPLIGSTLNFVLLGALLMQVHSYGKYWQTESRSIRALVVFVMVLGLADSANAFAILWTYLIQHNNDAVYLLGINQPLIIQSAFYVAQTFTCQVFFAYRIYFYSANSTSSRRMYSLLLPIWILLATVLGAMIYVTYSIATTKVYLPGGQEVRQPSRYSALPAFVSAFVLDCLLTFGLVKTFKKARNGFTSTDSRAEILKRIALQTGSLICLSTLLLIIVYLLPYSPTYAYALSIPLPKLYDISLFSVLLARRLDRPSQEAQRLMMDLPSFKVTHSFEGQPLDRYSTNRSRSSSVSVSGLGIATSEMLRPVVDRVAITETTNQSTVEMSTVARKRSNRRREETSSSDKRSPAVIHKEVLSGESPLTSPPAKAYRSRRR